MDKNYPNKQEAKEIVLDHQELNNCQEAGELVITDFPYLKEIKTKTDDGAESFISGMKNKGINDPEAYLTRDQIRSLEALYRHSSNSNNKVTNIKIVNCPQLEEVDISNFEGNKELIINSPKLKILNCSKNQLTDLTLISCSNIAWLDCNDNQFTNLDFLQNLSSKNLERLGIRNNNFSPTDLTPLENFTNLKMLQLGNNHFYDSLEPLKNMDELKSLDIGDTDIDSGLEYLPESLEEL